MPTSSTVLIRKCVVMRAVDGSLCCFLSFVETWIYNICKVICCRFLLRWNSTIDRNLW